MMDYAATLHWLYERLPMYQRVGPAALNPSLDRIIHLATYLGNPQHAFKSIHVAGTNGKGSSSHMLASILQEAGYRVGLYTSPHLKDFRERIRINGSPVSKNYVTQFIDQHLAFFEGGGFSFFEMTVGLAFAYFASEQVDVAVIEVGLGGRLDATNIITPEACLITNISLDHQQFLGTTRKAIAREKAGIIKPDIPVVVVEHDVETFPVFQQIADLQHAPLIVATPHHFDTDLMGLYQKQNINGVVSLLKQLRHFSISEKQIKEGLKKVVQNTGLRGRWEILGQYPQIIADVAHNVAGLQMVFAQIATLLYNKLHVVFGVVNDKDITDIMKLLPDQANYYLCAAQVPRALSVDALTKIFTDHKKEYTSYASVKDAYAAAVIHATKNDLIYVGGSVFVVAEVLP